MKAFEEFQEPRYTVVKAGEMVGAVGECWGVADAGLVVIRCTPHLIGEAGREAMARMAAMLNGEEG